MTSKPPFRSPPNQHSNPGARDEARDKPKTVGHARFLFRSTLDPVTGVDTVTSPDSDPSLGVAVSVSNPAVFPPGPQQTGEASAAPFSFPDRNTTASRNLALNEIAAKAVQVSSSSISNHHQ